VRGTRHGVLITNGPEGTIEEDAPACAHCGHIMSVKPFCDPAAFPNGRCKICNGLICDNPTCHERCDPMEKKLERWERDAKLLESMQSG